MSTLQPHLTEPIPFDPVQFLDAKRVTGLVLVPESRSEAGGEASANNKDCDDPLDLHFNASMDMSFASKAPPALQRKSSLNGNILWINDHEKAFFLQRKIGTISSNNGSVRVGFELQQSPIVLEDGDDEDEPSGTMSNEYNVIQSDGPYPFEMVAIKVQTHDAVMGTEDNTSSASGNGVVASSKVELAAMQLIANHYGVGMGGADASHVDYCHYVCLDRSTIYAIGPFYGDGSLFQCVVESGTLSEPVARHFFKQILTGLESLKKVSMCHRNLSLENVHLRGASHCALAELGSCLRMPSAENNDAALPPHMVVGGNPRYIPPEVIRTEPSFDVYAADLWASGIILCGMLFGIEAPFVWASPQDRRYMEICVNGNLKGLVSSRNFGAASSVVVSDDGIDLIQNMLRSSPSERLTLEQTMQHPWLQGETAVPDFPVPVTRKREG